MKTKALQICLYVLVLVVSAHAADPKRYLFVWAGDADKKASDFLAVLDVTPHDPNYGRIVASVPVGAVGTIPHHTEYSLSDSGFLFANGFESGKSFIFDVRDPLHPKLVRAFDEVQGYMSPHSFVRLPNGHVLASFHLKHGERGGGLVEFDNDGQVIRSASAVDPKALDVLIRPYSLAVLPNLDRLVSTSSSMYFLDGVGIAVQVWRLSDLKLLNTLRLSPGPRGYGHEDPQEPRVLADGKTVYVQTRSCGLHRITGLDTDNPKAEPVYTFEGGLCGVPIVVDNYWIEAVPAINGVVVLDVSNPARPVAVSQLSVGEKQFTHWLAWDDAGSRIILNSGGDDSMLFMLKFDRNTGKITFDKNFHDPQATGPGISLKDRKWPHGFQGTGIPHGAVFSR
ncbi:MAG: selenium-binding protein SBP56-related protein [Nitrospiraceae bacterium]